ncbi:terminase small subunit [Marinobacter sp. M1N3S26]|uniref:terminase small subunit n=1 Tax=Marinobacter sp. M1N3S26 TaxID=3382299 RepID=UPI00387B6666
MGKRVNKRELAEIFGISERSFTAYQKDPSFPVARSGGRGQANEYDTQDVHEWLVSRAVNGARHESARERLERIKGDREELGLAKDLEELVPAVLIGARLEQVVLAIRTGVLTGNPKLKTEIDALYDIDLDIELLNEHSRSVLKQLAALESQPGQNHLPGPGEVRAAGEDHLN